MQEWIKGIDYPEWMTEEGLKTLKKDYLQTNESPKQMYTRICDTIKNRFEITIKDKEGYNDSIANEIGEKWFSYFWKGWLAGSTPVLCNIGTKKGLPISCFVMRLEDSMESIFGRLQEMALLNKAGGATGVTFDKVRGRGEPISVGGFSEGVVPFMKVYDSAIVASNQGSTRRGSASLNLPIRHKDIHEFLNIRKPKGDVNKQCLNINHCVTIDDYFMNKVSEGDTESRKLYSEVLNTRMTTGQPYIMYYHNVHNQRPLDMVKRNLKVDGTNLCSEILLPHDKDNTVVCCISSINFSKYDEFENDDEFIELSYLFLDTVLSEFIALAEGKVGMERAINFAKNSRAIGLGVLGFATYLQSKNIPFISFQTRGIINKIGKKLFDAGEAYNKKYGLSLGSPNWCDSNRNITLRAIAPNTSSALICGGVSQGIEPIVANVYVQKTAKGTFIRTNPYFKHLIKNKYSEYDNDKFYLSIGADYKGSVQHLDFLSNDEKEVFLTAYEINQLELVKNAGIWQKYIDQGISLNLFFPADVDPKWLAKCHITAWEEGVKTLYYVRTESIASRDMRGSTFDECFYCQ